MFCINVPKQQSKCQLGAQPIVICYTTTKNPIILSDDHTRLGDHIRNSLCKGKKTLFCSSAKIWWLKVLFFFLAGNVDTVHFYDRQCTFTTAAFSALLTCHWLQLHCIKNYMHTIFCACFGTLFSQTLHWNEYTTNTERYAYHGEL